MCMGIQDPPFRCFKTRMVSRGPLHAYGLLVCRAGVGGLRQSCVANLGSDCVSPGVLGLRQTPDDAEVDPVLRVDGSLQGRSDVASGGRLGGRSQVGDVTHGSRGSGQGGDSEGLDGNHFDEFVQSLNECLAGENEIQSGIDELLDSVGRERSGRPGQC